MGFRVSRFTLAMPVTMAVVVTALVGACNSMEPPRGPEDTCARACEARATHCKREECWRGCNLVLDRLAEHEGDHVVACVALASKCNDRAWAHCAARVGVHADGGPPAPPPPPDIEDEDEP